MSGRKKIAERCIRCCMRLEHCLCSLIPTISISTKLVLIVGKREFKAPSNTGRLAAQALSNSVVLIHGEKDNQVSVTEHLDPAGNNLLLYPCDEAITLTPCHLKEFLSPVTLIVPDGNWRGTNKMRRRIPGLSDVQTVRLPSGLPSAYGVRRESKSGGLATIEAIARALGVIEGKAVQASLEALMIVMVSRILTSRGAV